MEAVPRPTSNTAPDGFPFEADRYYGHTVVPIFEIPREFEGGGDVEVLDFRGTGFRLGNDLLVTCWHCVEGVPEDRQLAVGYQLGETDENRITSIENLARDPNSSDLALGNVYIDDGVDHAVPSLLELSPDANPTSWLVWPYGYPHTIPELDEGTGRRMFPIALRLLRGSITMRVTRNTPYGRTPSFEVDMLAPEGISGAPLIQSSTNRVIGVIYGTFTTQLAERDIDPRTGEYQPATPRYVTFAGAHRTPSLAELCGPATQGLPLLDYLGV